MLHVLLLSMQQMLIHWRERPPLPCHIATLPACHASNIYRDSSSITAKVIFPPLELARAAPLLEPLPIFPNISSTSLLCLPLTVVFDSEKASPGSRLPAPDPFDQYATTFLPLGESVLKGEHLPRLEELANEPESKRPSASSSSMTSRSPSSNSERKSFTDSAVISTADKAACSLRNCNSSQQVLVQTGHFVVTQTTQHLEVVSWAHSLENTLQLRQLSWIWPNLT